ncbi:unnamed protein product, partial [Phaeothamnion confervicola]
HVAAAEGVVSCADLADIDALKAKRWASCGDAATALKNAAFQANKTIKIDGKKSGGKTKRWECATDGCSFHIRLQRSHDGSWHVSAADLEHMNCTGSAKLSARALSEVTSFRSAVLSQTDISARAAMGTTQRGDGVAFATNKATFRATYRAMELVRKEQGLAEEQEYQLLESFFAKFVEQNPGSTAVMERDEDGHFFRGFVMASSSVETAIRSLPVYSVDGAFMRGQAYNGQLLAMASRDPELRVQPIAFAVVAKEDYETYCWFLGKIKSDRRMAGLLARPFAVLVSDRQKGLLKAASELFPSVHHLFCQVHLLRNLVAKGHRNLGAGQQLFWSLAKATNQHAFDHAAGELQAACPGALKYLTEIGFESFTLWGVHTAGRPAYNCLTSNFIESLNATVLEARAMAPPQCLRTLVTWLAAERFARHAAASVETASIITGAVLRVYNEQDNLSRQYQVVQTDYYRAMVSNVNDPNASENIVEINIRSCSCLFWQQRGIPCRHAIAAARIGGLLTDARGWFETSFPPFYRSATLRQAYVVSINVPARFQLTSDGITKPALRVKSVGRPAVKRRRSAGEGQPGHYGGGAGVKKSYKCSRCGSGEHNARSCLRPITDRR